MSYGYCHTEERIEGRHANAEQCIDQFYAFFDSFSLFELSIMADKCYRYLQDFYGEYWCMKWACRELIGKAYECTGMYYFYRMYKLSEKLLRN